MNRIREIANKQGRKLVWLGKQIDMTRSAMDWKIDHDRFTPHQRAVLANALSVSETELFPDYQPSPEAA